MEQGNFKEMGDTLFRIISLFLQNEELVKLLYYTDKNPLSHPNLTNEQKEKMINRNFLVVPEVPDVAEDEILNFIGVTFDNFVVDPENPDFKKLDLVITVNCPTDQWLINDNSLRPFLIMSIVNGLLNHKNLNGVGKMNFLGAESFSRDEDLAGYHMLYGQSEFE